MARKNADIQSLMDAVHRRSQIAVTVLKTVIDQATVTCLVQPDDKDWDEFGTEIEEAHNAAAITINDLCGAIGELHAALEARYK
jgi:hypothetical protein